MNVVLSQLKVNERDFEKAREMLEELEKRPTTMPSVGIFSGQRLISGDENGNIKIVL